MWVAHWKEADSHVFYNTFRCSFELMARLNGRFDAFMTYRDDSHFQDSYFGELVERKSNDR